jgi:hypothetical protein
MDTCSTRRPEPGGSCVCRNSARPSMRCFRRRLRAPIPIARDTHRRMRDNRGMRTGPLLFGVLMTLAWSESAMADPPAPDMVPYEVRLKDLEARIAALKERIYPQHHVHYRPSSVRLRLANHLSESFRVTRARVFIDGAPVLDAAALPVTPVATWLWPGTYEVTAEVTLAPRDPVFSYVGSYSLVVRTTTRFAQLPNRRAAFIVDLFEGGDATTPFLARPRIVVRETEP